MKKQILFLIGLIAANILFAQVPQGISHQAVIRDANNELVANSPIGIQVSILQGSAEGEAVYVETHTPMSNSNGLITYIIGDGAVESGVFAEIDWSAGPYFLKTEADPMGGTDYTIAGVTQLLNVPYALHSITAEIAQTLKDGSHLGEINYWDGENWVPIEPGEHNQTLRLCDGVPTWGPCLYNLMLFADPLYGGSVTGEGEYEENDQISISAIPYPGWEFAGWTGDIEYIDDPTSANTSVTMPTQNVLLTANFQEEGSEIIYGDGITDIDGNEYETVIIGNQEWMAENLRVTKYRNGDPIPTGLDNTEWENTTDGAYAIFDHNHWSADGINSPEEMVAAYGKLYNWYAVDDSRGLCPQGWSVPSDADWTVLVNYVVSQGFPNNNNVTNGAGNALKSCRQVGHPDSGDCDTSEHPRWNSHGTHSGFDEFGFSALPGGSRWAEGSFVSGGSSGFWWSATAWHYRYMFSGSGDVYRVSDGNKRNGFSVRCFRDVTEEPTLYNLQLEVHPEGAGSVSGAGEYEEGELVNVTATSNTGWVFVNWTDSDGVELSTVANFIYTMPPNNVTLTANFQEDESDIIYGDGVTDIDGNFYPSVIIGNQEWMAENLRVTRYKNEDDIPTGLSNTEWSNTTSGAYAIYDHNASNTDGINSPEEMVAAYGKLYNWYAVDDARGLCPQGWSVPSHHDWTQLEQYICNVLGNSDCETHFPYDNTTEGWRGTNEVNALKSCRQVGSPVEGCNTPEHPRWISHSTHYGFNEFGFSALPGGVRWFVGSFDVVGSSGLWWSGTDSNGPGAWSRSMGFNLGTVARSYSSKQDGYSVRCFRDLGAH